MTANGSVILLLAIVFTMANLPFVFDRILFVVRPRDGRAKGFGWRLLELVLLYFAVGALALLIERRAGQIAPQGWEFYAVTGALFATLAFPGFIYRYLVRGKSAPEPEQE